MAAMITDPGQVGPGQTSQTGGKMSRALLSSDSDTWATPADFFAAVDRHFGPFDLDPCCSPDTAKAPHYYTENDNGLAREWFGRVFMNPPYSAIAAWMAKAAATARAGFGPVVCLVPARTDTRWFWDHALPATVLLLPGRLRFESFNVAPAPSPLFPDWRDYFADNLDWPESAGAKNSAPFPSALIVMRPFLPWHVAGVYAWDWRNAAPPALAL